MAAVAGARLADAAAAAAARVAGVAGAEAAAAVAMARCGLWGKNRCRTDER